MPAYVALVGVFLLVSVGYPILTNVLMSVQDVNVGNLRSLDRPFLGLDNFRELLSDPLFPRVVRNTVLFVGASVGLTFTFGFALALFFDLGFPGAGWLRGLFLAAWFLPPMIVGALFKWIMASEAGLFNALLMGLGLLTRPEVYLSDPGRALWVVVFANVWFGTPFCMILLAAGLAAVPQELYEAAALDGAGRGGRFRYVTWPMMLPTTFAVLALSVVYTLRVFDLIWTMTRGGPVDSTNILPLWSYLFSFELFRFGMGAAISVLLLLVVLLVAALYVRAIRTEQA